MVLKTSKDSGHRRTVPQEQFEKTKSQARIFKCNVCGVELQSQGILVAHVSTHSNKSNFDCDSCGESFSNKGELEDHIIDEHKQLSQTDEWTCNDCPFQGNLSSQLMKHLKITSHQPSPGIKDRKSLFLDYKKCYTCKQEFDGHWNLMQHRKFNHPSNRKCRNYPEKCVWGNSCWWVHEDAMEIDNSPESNFKCNICSLEFKNKSGMMEHKKEQHPTTISVCSRFLAGDCFRSMDNCWFKHPINNTKEISKSDTSKSEVPEVEIQDFRKAQPNLIPPDQMKEIMNMICQKMEVMVGRVMEENLSKIMRNQ